MRHDITLEGHAFRLRPIADADAAFVVELRSDPARGRFLHAGSGTVPDQLEWLARYYARAGDYYFVLDRRGSHRAEGLIGLYDLDEQARTAECGRWILRRGSLAAVECMWLIYRVAFERLGLSAVCSRTVAANTAVVSFHDSCGISDRQLLPGWFELAGQRHDAIQHRLDRGSWSEVGPRLERLALRTARKIIA